MKYLLIGKQQYSENEPEYGCGDYPAQIEYILAVVEGDTTRKAQNAAKKLFPRIRFGSMFSPMLIEATAENIALYGKTADDRLSFNNTKRHTLCRIALGV